MDIHGIAMYSEFEVNKESQEKAAFVLSDSEITRRHYPFAFRFQVTYELRGSTVWITYEVENRGEKEMYFGVGGHPGFVFPLGHRGRSRIMRYILGRGQDLSVCQSPRMDMCWRTETMYLWKTLYICGTTFLTWMPLC